MSKVKTRFAPSPTGYMHIGNLRTALYAYLLARSQEGTFILRIEDTDRQRMVEGAVQVIYDTLKAARLTYDEGPDCGGPCGPYVQSERTALYKDYAEKLVQSGHAYYCFCTKERLSAIHNGDQSAGYDRHCRTLSAEEIRKNLSDNVPYVIRQKTPLDGTTTYFDQIFGEITVPNADLQDLVLLKADGYPTYNFAHVVDDYLMGVTHVVRGSEYVTSTPSYVLLYDAFGWERPQYIHLPLIMGRSEDGTVSKLSKRHGAVSFQDLLREGYLPEAIINYVALLGWNPKTDEEIFSLEELEKRFSTAGISKSPAIFDYEKLLWFNGVYIRNLSEEEFAQKVRPYLEQILGTGFDLNRIAELIHPRLEKFSQVENVVSFLVKLPEFENDLFVHAKNKVTLENAPVILKKSLEILKGLEDWKNEPLFLALKGLAPELGVKPAAVMWAVRIAVSGLYATPGGATDILELLGRQESIARLESACARF